MEEMKLSLPVRCGLLLRDQTLNLFKDIARKFKLEMTYTEQKCFMTVEFNVEYTGIYASREEALLTVTRIQNHLLTRGRNL